MCNTSNIKTVSIKLTTINDVKNFISKAMSSPYEMDLQSDRHSVDAKSIMGIFSLDLSKPITLVIHDSKCEDFLSTIKEFIA